MHQPLSDLGLLLDALSSEHEAPQIKGSSSKRDAALAALLQAAESAANGPSDQSVETTIGGLTSTTPADCLPCSPRASTVRPSTVPAPHARGVYHTTKLCSNPSSTSRAAPFCTHTSPRTQAGGPTSTSISTRALWGPFMLYALIEEGSELHCKIDALPALEAVETVVVQ